MAFDGEEALRQGMTGNFDVMLLDVMLPRMNGITVITHLRSAHIQTQTILVSARDSMEDIVHGLDAGADDYLTKPFPLDVLLAKVRAAARRVPIAPPQEMTVEDLVLHPHRFELQRGIRAASLTRTECALLRVLMRRSPAVVPHALLIEEGWDAECDVSHDSLYVFIRALRTKITRPGETELVQTIRGVGYALRSGACS